MQINKAAGKKFHKIDCSCTKDAFSPQAKLKAADNVHNKKTKSAAENHGPVCPATPEKLDAGVKTAAKSVDNYKFQIQSSPGIFFPQAGILI